VAATRKEITWIASSIERRTVVRSSSSRGFPSSPRGRRAASASHRLSRSEGKDVFERIAVERGRQDAEGELLRELTSESFLGLDAGVRTEVHRPLRRNEVKEIRAQPVREITLSGEKGG
jgi:hypothetical protein